VRECEPERLRQPMGAFSQTNHYSRYLTRWKKSARPNFLDLYAELGKTLAGLRDTVTDLTTSTGALTDSLQKVGVPRPVAADKLSEATPAQQLAGQKHSGRGLHLLGALRPLQLRVHAAGQGTSRSQVQQRDGD